MTTRQLNYVEEKVFDTYFEGRKLWGDIFVKGFSERK